jgi:hypothetical protein
MNYYKRVIEEFLRNLNPAWNASVGGQDLDGKNSNRRWRAVLIN